MADSFIVDVEDILGKIPGLVARLADVPRSRDIQCMLVPRGNDILAKPRFQPPSTLIDAALKHDFLEIREKILDFYQEYCPHRDIAWIEEILHPNSDPGTNKSGILFLLENDVWGCSDVYGDYLVENQGENKYGIYYWRRDQARNTLAEFKEYESEDAIKQFVIEDALDQLKRACEARWARIIQDINDCRFEYEQIITKYGQFKPKQTLKATFSKGKRLVPINLFLACLSLGYVAEMWIKEKLHDYRLKFCMAITKASNQGTISTAQAALLNDIKKEYNLAKHDANHVINAKKIEELYLKYELVIGIS